MTMQAFVHSWEQAATISIGFFWMALWAFALGYLISSLIQVLVTRKRMQETMGESGLKSVAIGTFFGFISSSCSFAALSTTRALFQRGAGLVPSLAFMLSSTNLVIELGIVIAIFLSWQFVAAEYLGGLLLIGLSWLFVRLTYPKSIVDRARSHLQEDSGEEEGDTESWRKTIISIAGWRQISRKYVMEWQMVWKDVLIGFTVAGIIAAFVPNSFFETLFIGSGGGDPTQTGFFEVLAQALVGPVAAFFTFIGSMGNIPLAALLYERGVSFAGVMAFIFSDLVVLPVLRINARYYGWPMALYILGLLLVCLVTASLTLHYGFAALDLLPVSGADGGISQRSFFSVDTGFMLNCLFLLVSGILVWLWHRDNRMGQHQHDHGAGAPSLADRVLTVITGAACVWLLGGLLLKGARLLGIGG